MSEQVILFGAGDEGRHALAVLGAERVLCFADNDPQKQGRMIDGKEIVSFQRLRALCDAHPVVVSVSFLYEDALCSQLTMAGVPFVLAHSFFEAPPPPSESLLALSGLYRGERCFLIGNGPSLTVEDLNRLRKKGAITFGANKIFKLFSKTDWRPTLYCAIDTKLLYHYDREIATIPAEHLFLADFRGETHYRALSPELVDAGRLHLFHRQFFPFTTDTLPPFSQCPPEYVAEGFTVSYAMLQWAAYLGFSELVLLGQDFRYSDPSGQNQQGNDYFCEDYFKPGEFASRTDVAVPLAVKAMERAATELCELGVRVYNATPGSALKCFPSATLSDFL